MIQALRTSRFIPILEKALQVGLETTVLKKNLINLPTIHGSIVPEGFSLRDPNRNGDKPDAKTVSFTHPATINSETDFLNALLAPLETKPKPLVITFQKLPEEISPLFQKINIKQCPALEILGLVCGRFTIHSERPEIKPFIIKHEKENLESPVGHLNLDCFSETKKWNPLFIKYRFNVAPALREFEFGYIKIEIQKRKKSIVVTISRVSEDETPDHLKKAQTFPR